MAVLRTDYSLLQTTRVGSGMFGAKTTELTRFKHAIEAQSGLSILPHTSFSMELFRLALVRAGHLDENGEYRPNGSTKPVKLTKKEAEAVMDWASVLDGLLLAVRADERSAKGSGVFSTEFQFGTINEIIQSMERILQQQFEPTPMVFKRLTRTPHEIGIQLMPLGGEVLDFYGKRLYGPSLSVSGLTNQARGTVKFSAGFGLGGGVSSESCLCYQNGELQGRLPEMPDATMIDLDRGRTKCYSAEALNLPIRGYDQLGSLMVRMLAVAQASGTDVYFEAQLVDHKTETWAITQITNHAWPNVTIPQGEELVRINGYASVVGSGVEVFDKLLVLPSPSSMVFGAMMGRQIETPQEKYARLITKDPDACVAYGEYMFGNDSLEMLERIRALINVGIRIRPFSTHVGGVFRETGKIIFFAGTDIRFISRLNGRRFAVWADEGNGIAGVTLV